MAEKKGTYWIDKLKDLFKEEKIDEEDDSWHQHTGSVSDNEYFGNFSEENASRSDSQDGEEISFLAKDSNQQKDLNRQIYQKIADAFMHENSTFIEKEEQEEDNDIDNEGGIALLQKQEHAKKAAVKEFDEEFIKSRDTLKLSPQLDIVEMNVFDRIALYQDHTIWQKIYKKVWYIKSMITSIALKIVKSKPFEVSSLCVIAFNSVMLARDDPTTSTDNNATIDLSLLIIYTIEMCFKIVALGFIFNQDAYMRDPWNIVDIVIIGTGYLPYIISGSSFNLSALRSLRVLRPLKSVTKIKALKQLLTALFSAIPLLKDSIIILMFFFIIFGIAGLQLFTGQLKSRCIDPQTGIMTGDNESNVVVCSTDTDCSGYQNSLGIAYVCAKSMVSPISDTIQFDTFGWSVLNVYEIVSLEGWTKIMNLMQDGFNQFSVLYFFLAVYIGAFFLLNLTMAIIGVKYSEAISDQKEKIAAIVEEPGYDMKQLIEWGLYKSNKIYYQELEEDKKIKRSLFGFSFLNLSRNMKSSKNSQKNQSSEQPPPQPENAALLPQIQLGGVANANGQQQNENQQLALPPPLLLNNQAVPPNVNLNIRPVVAPLMLSSATHDKQQPLSPKDFSPAGKKRGQDKTMSKFDGPAVEIPKLAQIPSFKNNSAFGSSMRSLRGGNLAGKTKILTKKIMKIDNGMLKKIPIAPKKLSPKNSDHSQLNNNNNNNNSSDNFPHSQHVNQTEDNPEHDSQEDKLSKSVHSSHHNSTNLILPHLLVGQLEQINKKNDQGLVLSKEKSNLTSIRPTLIKNSSKNQEAADASYGIQVTEGNRKVNLVPLQNKNVNLLKQSQKASRLNQHHSSKKPSGIFQPIGKNSGQTQINSNSSGTYLQNPDDNDGNQTVLGQNYLNPSGGFQLGSRKSVLGATQIMNAGVRRGSRKNARRGDRSNIIHSTMIGGTVTPVNQTHVQNIYNDDWMNDDFLREIEIKEKAEKAKKAAADAAGGGINGKSPVGSQTQLSVVEDMKIEENYFSNSMPIKLLKQQKDPLQITSLKKKQSSHRDGSVKPLSKKESIEVGDGSFSPSRRKHGHERTNSNTGRVLSSKRMRNQSNSGAYNSSSKTKTITQFDQLSEESDISINKATPANGNNNSNFPSGSDFSPKGKNNREASILFNDGEFLEIFGGKKRQQMRVVPLDNKKKERKSIKPKMTLREQKSSYNEFKRQESRNITKVVNNYGKIDDKFDIKKEETLLLLENAHLKARVIYDQPYDYVEDVQPMKRKRIKEKKRLEQHNKLKRMKFSIDYSNQRGGKKKKYKTFENIDKARTFPVRRSDVIDYLLNDNPFAALGNENLDPILKEDGISKKISQAGDKNANQQIQEGLSYTNPHFNKQTMNMEPSIKGLNSLQNIEKEIENSEQNHFNHRELPSGRKLNKLFEQKLQSEDNQGSLQDIQAAIVGKDGASLARSGTENKIIEMEIDAGSKQLKHQPTQQGVNNSILGGVPSSGPSMRQVKLPNNNNNNNEPSVAASRSRVGISSMKNSSRAGAAEKGGKQKKKGDAEVKFTLSLAQAKIFADDEATEVHQEVKHPNEFQFMRIGDVSSKETSKMTLITLQTKDSKISDGSESMSKLNSAGVSSNNSLSRDSENIGNSVNQSSSHSKEEDGKFKIDEVFANEPVEDKFMKIRKNEIKNLEKKGKNQIKTEWSASAILPLSLYQKSQKSIDRMLKTINHTKYDSEQNEGGIIGIIQAFRRRVKYFVQSSVFDNFVMLCVILNTVILSLDGLVTSTSGQDLMTQFNTIFTIIFAIDMGLKITGYGLSEYVADRMNIFDAFIVSLSLFEMIFLTGSGSSFSAFRAVRILRVFRVLRVTRLIRSLQFMKLMITALGSAISQFIYIFLLLLLFMFIYTLLGMSIFGGNLYVSNPGPPTRMNFDDFFASAFAVLDLLTVENWNDLKTLCIRSTDINNYISVAYLISWIFIGNYVFMNLVLAIIMDSFDSDEVQEDKQDIENQFEVVADLDLNHQSVGTTFLGQTTSLNMGSTFNQSKQHGSLNRSQTSLSKGVGGSGTNLKNSQSQLPSQQQQNNSNNNDSLSQRSGSMKRDSDLQEKDKLKQLEEDDEDGQDNDKKKKGKQFVYFDGVFCQKSFYVFSQKNFFRRILYRFYKHSIFEQMVFLAIVLSSLKLTIDTYVSDNTSTFYIVGTKIDIVFTAFFTAESLLKMICQGLIMDKGSYLRDEWSQLDLFIVICSLIDVSVSSIDLSVIKILRLLRTLRPLRLLNHNKSMKLIVTALMESVGGISNMIIVVILIWLMFAILGLNLMKDKLSYCNFNSSINYDLYTYHQTECVNIPGATWSVYDINCDNIGNAMLFLFILSSFEGWPAYVYNFIDASDTGPVHANSYYFGLFFAVFIFVGSFFSINLFSAIMAFNFDIASKKAKNEFLTDQQSQWIELQRLIVQSTPDFASMRQPTNRFRFFLWKIVTSNKLEVFIISCIMANIVTMAMAYDTSPSSYDAILQDLNYAFTGVFVLECILKIIAFGPGGYFFNSWNKFDFFVVCASIVDIVTAQIGKQLFSFMKAGPQLIRVMRVMRVSRLLKLIKSFQNLQKLIQTTIFALPSLLNATALFLLFYFIFSILSVYLFQHVTTGNIVNHLNNFTNFHNAFIVLFRCSTGEDWMTIMFDVVRGTNTYSIFFFLCFIVTQSYIMMNLFVLIIMNEFEENYIDPDNPLQNFREQEESFKSLWVIMTQKDFGVKIHERSLTDFYFSLPEPLGYDYETKRKQFTENLKLHNRGISEEEVTLKCDKFKVKQKQEADKHIMQMNIFCDYEGYIYFNELFFFFFKFSLEEKLNEEIPNRPAEKIFQALTIVRKEEIISLKKINFLKKKQSQLMKQKIAHKRKEGVNPMVRKLFVSMCFSSWLTYSKNTQKKINQMNFNNEDISSESDTDSDAENQNDQSDFFKAEEEEDGIQFRLPNGKKAIVSREHTIFQRIKGLKDREADNLIEHDKYIFLPNTEIYKDDFVQMGEGANYYSQRVFSTPVDPKVAKQNDKSDNNKAQTPVHNLLRDSRNGSIIVNGGGLNSSLKNIPSDQQQLLVGNETISPKNLRSGSFKPSIRLSSNEIPDSSEELMLLNGMQNKADRSKEGNKPGTNGLISSDPKIKLNEQSSQDKENHEENGINVEKINQNGFRNLEETAPILIKRKQSKPE